MFIFLDTETTGTGSDDRLCQIAFKPEDAPAVCELFNPSMPISIDAMAIHHITNKMVQDKPPFQGSEAHLKLRELVRNGYAEVYRGEPAKGFDSDPYWRAEEQAKSENLNIWSLGDHYVSTREWRRRNN